MLKKIAAASVLGGSYTATALGSANLGDVFWLPPRNDGIGWRGFRLVRCLEATGMSIRELMARVADVTGTVTATSPEVNSITQLSDTDAFTQDPTLVGDLLVITDDAGAAGAAPEGEFAVISYQDEANDDFLNFDTDFPLSAAPAVGDTYRIRRMWQGDNAADADLNFNILGILPAAFSVGEFGYVLAWGIGQVVRVTTTACVVDQGVRAAAVGITGGDDGTSFIAENIGIALDTFGAGNDGTRASIHIDVIHGFRGNDAVYNRE